MEKSLENQITEDCSILAQDEDFQIRKLNNYSYNYNITYRSPRKSNNKIINQVATTTIDLSKLNGLRTEKIDNEVFIINDQSRYDDPVRMKVVNFDVANQLIKTLVMESAVKEVHLLKYVPEKYVRINHIINASYPSILTVAGVIFMFSASFRLLVG